MRLCIISPNKQAWSETFIKAHIEKLDEVVGVLYGGHLPTHIMPGDVPLLEPTSFARGKRLLQAKLSGKSMEAMQREAIAKWLRSNKVELVLAEYGPTGAEIMHVCRSEKIPFVVHFHGIDAYHVDILSKYGERYKAMFLTAAAIVVVSRHMERQLLSLGVPRERLFYNCYGVDVERFSGADPALSEPHFVSIGRFTEKKAPYLTLLAFKKVLREVPEARLTMIGDGALLDPCRKIIKALGMELNVELPGILPPEEVASTLMKARAFVQHSLVPHNNDHEGTPLAVIEACAAGIPVISTFHAGIPDVVEHQISGLLSAENELAPMVEHMVLLAKNADLAGRMGAAGRMRVLDDLTQDKSIASLQNMLQKVVEAAQ